MTASALAALNVRDILMPLPLPLWSSENNVNDWIPEAPLNGAARAENGGRLQRALDQYYLTPTDAALLNAVAAFRSAVETFSSTGVPPVCAGGAAGSHPTPEPCVEARRWMSSLTGMHFARKGVFENIPLDVVRLWWETGEAAVSANLIPRGRPVSHERRQQAAGWLYLAFSFAPTEFREENGYFGQFLQSEGYSHLATFTALRRMVGTGRVHTQQPSEPQWDGQRFWDGLLAVVRAPKSLKLSVALFVADYLIGRIEGGDRYSPEAAQLIEDSLRNIEQHTSEAPGPQSARLELSHRLARLDGLWRAALRN
ncbi:MAG: hypothetical protein HOP28_04450 [Gemmatimonadales bacterium]|nr:hypothetical protein [Gemmatimonadales bacterium]